jgi:hypothetical protein
LGLVMMTFPDYLTAISFFAMLCIFAHIARRDYKTRKRLELEFRRSIARGSPCWRHNGKRWIPLNEAAKKFTMSKSKDLRGQVIL